MNFNQISRLVRLHEKAEQHSNEYKKLLGNCSAQSKALRHLREAERLRSPDFAPYQGSHCGCELTRNIIGVGDPVFTLKVLNHWPEAEADRPV